MVALLQGYILVPLSPVLGSQLGGSYNSISWGSLHCMMELRWGGRVEEGAGGAQSCAVERGGLG